MEKEDLTISLRAQRGNLIRINAFYAMRLLRFARNDTKKMRWPRCCLPAMTRGKDWHGAPSLIRWRIYLFLISATLGVNQILTSFSQTK
jgi:hypothetical protein